MTRRALILGIWVITVLMLSGCFIQSLQPFYAPDTVVDVPDLIGEWRLVQAGGDNVSAKYPEPWLFTGTLIRTYEKGISSTLRVAWFRVDDTLFADLSADDRSGGNHNAFWAMHAIPVHSVCKVELDGSSLRLIPLDGDWLLKKIVARELMLTYTLIGGKDDHYALTSPAKDLSAFLRYYRKSAEAFPLGNAYEFQLVKKTYKPAGS